MSSLKVAVRVRPFNQRENDMDASLIVQMEGKKTRLIKPKLSSIRDTGRDNYHDFTFDYSYWSFDNKDNHFVDQEQVYNDLGTDVIDCAFQGYNACVFAYGQTGSGKTFTMMGTPDNPGLIPRICQELFKRIKIGQESGTGYKTHASYLEIYNERVKDLLGSQNVGHGLRVREHRNLGPYVENLSQHAVGDYDEIQECIMRGNHQRTTASTNMNDTSSRSHAIFTITFVQAGFMNDMPSETVSKIHLVDLAGSERANATGATGQRLKEGAHINKSLVTLGSVISALAEQTNNRLDATKRILYIPYRDSVLTWLLKDSLGGNSKTIMIAAISPAECNYSETLSTLRYANRAKNIINKPTINEDPNVKLIRELREEINKLKSMLSSEVSLVESSSKVLEDLMKKEEQEKVLTEEWTEKWREAQLILKEQKSLGLRKAGVGVVLDSEMPHLIGIHNDITTGVTLYSLKEGETLIGTEDADTPQDIVLSGTGMQPKHCSIILKNGIATLHPHSNAQCWLNANLIDEPTGISQGDIILLGRTNIFRFNNPAEAAKLRQDLNTTKSRLDLSRLSLITASRENLLNTSYYSEDDMMTNSFLKVRQYFPTTHISRDDPELQDENRKILETIENALKQLNIERVQMHEQYKSKVRKLTEKLECLKREERQAIEIINCREQELLAKKDMILWEKNNEKVQIDIVCRQISALQTQLDSKKRDFYEYVAKELQELQDCGKLDEIGIKITESTPVSDDLLLQVSESLDVYSSQIIKDTLKKNSEEIKKLDEQITEKEKLLHTSTERITRLDEDILDLDMQLNQLKQIVQSQQTETEDLKLKKQSMKLNLKKTTDADAQTDDSTIEKNLKLDTLETCDTYHTANSDCSFVSVTTPISHINQGKLQSSSMQSSSSDDQRSLESGTPPHNNNNNNNHLMSDSGVCLDLVKLTPNEGPSSGASSAGGLLTLQHHHQQHQQQQLNSIATPTTTTTIATTTLTTNIIRNGIVRGISDEDSASCSSCDQQTKDDNTSRPYCIMHRLRRKMAAQKALIMKNLELDVNKSQLDEQIAQLQELKKKYVEIEKEIQISGGHMECCLDRDLELFCDNLECTSVSGDSKITSYEPATLMSPMNDSIYSPRSERYSPSMTRSCPSMDGFNEPDQFLTIPGFVLRGAGKQTHYEYEIRINLPDGKLNILRRYSRFRELHLSMKHCYGTKVSMLPFPRRELFSSNSESVAKQRRRLLELYLRRLLIVCSKIPQSSIYDGPGGPGLTKTSLAQFSPFFKKGLFECGKHGTG